MSEIIEFIKGFDLHNLISMAVVLWFFKTHLDKKFEKIDSRFEKIDARFEKMDARFEKMDAKFTKKIDDLDAKFTKKIDDLDAKFTKKIDCLDCKVNNIDKRLVSIETMLHVKDCCMLKDSRLGEKVE